MIWPGGRCYELTQQEFVKLSLPVQEKDPGLQWLVPHRNKTWTLNSDLKKPIAASGKCQRKIKRLK